MKKLFLLLYWLSLGIVLLACKDEEVDYCYEAAPFKANFTINELMKYGSSDSVVPSDSVITNNWIVFEAVEEYKTYEWKIGDKFYNTRTVKSIFENPESLEVRLIARKAPKRYCLSSIDTVTKHLTVIDWRLNPIFGEYEGSNLSNTADVFNIQVVYDYNNNQAHLHNINKGCSPGWGFITSMGYKKLSFYSNISHIPFCRSPQGWLEVDDSGMNVNVLYSFVNNGFTRMQEEFKGRRVN